MPTGRTIGVLTPLVSGPYFGVVLTGVMKQAARSGARVVVVQTLDPEVGDTHPGIPEVTSRIAWDRIDGLVVVSLAAPAEHIAAVQTAGIPLVLVSHEVPGLAVPSVMPENAGGIAQAVDHLVEHGHRRIAFAGHPVQADIAARYGAYLDAMTRHGLADQAQLIDTFDSMESGGEVAAGVLMWDAGVTAVVTGNDLNALGLISALERSGRRVPDDVAVVGFDDTPAAEHREPPLTSVNQNVEAIGARAARLLLEHVEGDPAPPGRHLVPTSLVVRESCGCRPDVVEPGADQDAGLGDRLCRVVAAGWAVGAVPDEVASACEDLATVVQSVLDGGSGRGLGDRLRGPCRTVYRYRPRPETVTGVLTVVQRSLAQADPAERDALVRAVAHNLGEARTRAQADTSVHLQQALRHEFDISMELLRGRDHDPASLRWLLHSPVHAGALALWTGERSGPEQERELRVVSLSGDVDPSPAGTVRPGEFPPSALLDAVGRHPGSVVVVLPVKTDERDWGLLALVGPPESRTATGREVYFQWAAMLSVALDYESMVDSLRAQQVDLSRAVRREHDLAESIRSSEERYALASSATNDGLWDWDVAADRIYYSPRWKAMLGHTEDEVGSTPGEWLDRVHPDDLPALAAVLERCRRGAAESFEHAHRIAAADGSHRWALCRGLAVPGGGAPATRLVGSMSDITERRALEDQLRRQALFDTLTGLPNRALFTDRLAGAIARAARRHDEQFAVVFLDLDGFKVVNDSLGHTAGDELLRQVASRIRDCLRATDTAARIGGDEFTVLIEGLADLSVVPGLTEKIQAVLAEPYDLDRNRLVVTASAGVTTSAFGYTHPDDVLRDADIAMYRAKTRVRGSCEVYDPSMHERAVVRLRTESDLRQGIEDGDLRLRFQPIVHMGTEKVTAMEALVRWQRADREVCPADFLAVAEETGLVVPMGRQVVAQACQVIRSWREDGTLPSVVPVSINVSHREFWDESAVAELLRAIDEHALTGEWLTVEITERVLMDNVDAARVRLQELRSAGIRLHVDDFGTGYSSLEALHRFPIDALKIDQSFVARLEEDRRSRELVGTIVMMARGLDLDVIAEGVETVAQQEILLDLGCERGQGFLFARPMTPDEVRVALA